MALGATNRWRGPLSNAVARGALGLCLLTAAPARAGGPSSAGASLFCSTSPYKWLEKRLREIFADGE